jgi:hypothetical protein
MRWQFVDRITRFDRWAAIEGVKAVSLEEYSLLEPLGRKGALPEVLVLESCVQLARWLVAASSEFRESCLLCGVHDFAIQREAGAGCMLALSVTSVSGRRPPSLAAGADAEPPGPDNDRVEVQCVVDGGRERLAHGRLLLRRIRMNEVADADAQAALWRELYGKT